MASRGYIQHALLTDVAFSFDFLRSLLAKRSRHHMVYAYLDATASRIIDSPWETET